MNKLFNRFRGRLMAEAVCRASLAGALVGGSIELAFLIVMHLVSRDPGWFWIGCVFAVPFLVTFAILFGVVYYPTKKRIAGRIDGTGLADRAGTMLEYKDRSSTLIDMQRTDAIKRIGDTRTNAIPFRIAPKIAVAALVVVALSAGSMFVPYDIMSFFRAEASEIERAEAELLRTLIEALRLEIKEGEIKDPLKDALYDAVDDLEDGLKVAEGQLGKAAQLSEAESRVEDILEGELSREKIGTALRGFETTSTLGIAIRNGNTDMVSISLDQLKSEILLLAGGRQAQYLRDIADQVKEALAKSGVPESDSLYEALRTFADQLGPIADGAAENEDVTAQVEEVVEQAKNSIKAVLGEQNKAGVVRDNMVALLRSAKSDLLTGDFLIWESDTVSEDDPQGETAETAETTEVGETTAGEENPGEDGDPSEGESEGEGESDSENTQESPNGKPADGTMTSMRESIYDPALGTVPYGEVFAAYYADYLASVNDGEFSAEAQDILEKYFEALNK